MTLPVLIAGSASTLAIFQCVLLVRLGNRMSTGWVDRIALYLTIISSSLILYSTLNATTLQSISFLACLAGSLLTYIGYRGTPSQAEVSTSTVDIPRTSLQLSTEPRSQHSASASPISPSSTFPYLPLADGQIRLLKFSDKELHDGGPLQFDLFHVKLSQRPQYVALSYSWGQSNQYERVNILVNGRRFRISQNLADALHKVKQNNISTLWVDAISINQQDGNEKSREVTRMFAIYRTAQMVIVWLGLNVGSRADMEALATAVEEIDRPTTRLHPNAADGSKLFALDQLLSQPYWSRVWILQEIAAAKQARLFWNSYIFDLRPIETLLRDRHDLPNRRQSSRDLAQQVISLRAACRAQQKPRLMDILALTTSSSTTVLRDKVYGLLGLASDWTDFVQEPNYSTEVSENKLGLEMTSNHILWYSSADIIFLRSISPHQAELPSWCPDYFHFKPHVFDKNLIPFVCGKNVNLGWERRRAFGQGSPNMDEAVPDTFIVNGDRLRLKGRRIGSISALGCLIDEASPPHHYDNSISAKEITDRDIGKAFRRLLLICHNQTYGQQPSSTFFSLLYALPDHVFQDRGHMRVKQWLETHKRFFSAFGVNTLPSSDDFAFIARRAGRLNPSSKVLPEWREFFSINEDNTISRRGEHPLYPMLASISSILEEHMRVMYIHDQVLLGWAHRDAQPNDTVWHLEGCTLQAVLRKSDRLSEECGETIYKLVGHAYVDPVTASGRWIPKGARSRIVNLH